MSVQWKIKQESSALQFVSSFFHDIAYFCVPHNEHALMRDTVNFFGFYRWHPFASAIHRPQVADSLTDGIDIPNTFCVSCQAFLILPINTL